MASTNRSPNSVNPGNKETREELKARTLDEGEAVDRLSDLPDHVVLKIISLIPIKEAVRTCILSSRWKDVFTSISNIDLGGFLGNKSLCDSMMNFMDGFLLSRKDLSVDRLCLYCERGMDPCRISRWMQYGIRHGVRRLNLNIGFGFNELRFEVFACETLVTLRLSILPCLIMSVPTNCCLPNLKILHLCFLKFSDNESIGRLLWSCNSLEELLVDSCELCNINKLSVCHPNLKSLTINGWNLGYELEFDTPNLVYFKFEYFYRTMTRHLFINLNSLSEARIRIGVNTDAGIAPAIDLIRGISHVQSLHLTGYSTEMLTMILSPGLIPMFPNLTHLKMAGCIAVLRNLLVNCPFLETLAFDCEDIGPVDGDIRKEVPYCLVHRIKEIKLFTFKGKHVEFHLVGYLLEKAEVLQSLTVELSATKRDKISMGEEICSLPKVSSKCRILVI